MRIKIHRNKLAYSLLRQLKKESARVKLKYTPYTLERLRLRGITVEEVQTTINEGVIIEYHTLKDDRRILLRSAEGICVVLDLDIRRVITAYRNSVEDKHTTLDVTEYLFGA